MRTSAVVLICLLLAGAIFLFSRSGFRSAELTMEELISVYDIPIKGKPTAKFEWTVVGQKYFRAVVEESPADRIAWNIRETYPFNLPARTGVLIYTITNRGVSTAGGNAWLIQLRIGGKGGMVSGWSGSTFLLPVPASNYTTESVFNDPDRVLIVRTSTRHFRLRMESSNTPYGK